MALKLLERGLQINPKHAASLVARTWIWQTMGGGHANLEREYKDILALFPRHASALCNYGLYLHSIKGDVHSAAQLYRRCLVYCITFLVHKYKC